MIFTSLLFIAFLLIVYFVYFLFPLKWQWTVLLFASIVFYCSWDARMLLCAVVAALVTFIGGRLMDKVAKKRKVLMWLTIGIILGLLIFFKVGTIVTQELQKMNIVAPLGISYYTLSLVGYLADVYWKKEQPERNCFKFMLFTLYFPKILQGPISRYGKLAKQLTEGHKWDYGRACFGAQRMLWGYIKKLVIAERLHIFVQAVFDNYNNCSGPILVIGAISAAIQLYCDFSGYMDMAAGMSQIVGIELEENFRQPFMSQTAAEFWRRWHITLGTWFKDYVYMPLAVSPGIIKMASGVRKKLGKRAGKNVAVVIPLAVVWLLTGLWHGTGFPYIVWGIYWGILIIVSAVLAPEINKLNRCLKINTETKSFQVFRIIRTFILFAIGRVITIPNNLHVTGAILKKMVFEFEPWIMLDGTLYRYGLDRYDWGVVIVFILLLGCVSSYQQKGSVREKIAECNLVVRWSIYYAAFFALVIFGVYGPEYNAADFIYMNF